MDLTAEKLKEILSQYPIAELNDERQRNALIHTLLNGEKRVVSFERVVVPADVVGKYILVEHTYPPAWMPTARHLVSPIREFDNHYDATRLFSQYLNKHISSSDEEFKEVMLVGQFKGQEIRFDGTGRLDTITGINMGTA